MGMLGEPGGGSCNYSWEGSSEAVEGFLPLPGQLTAREKVASGACADVGVSESRRCPVLQRAQLCADLPISGCQPGVGWVSGVRANGKGWAPRRPRMGLAESRVLTDSGELFPAQTSSSPGFRLASFRRRPLRGRPGSAIEAASRSRRWRGAGASQAVSQAGSG